jgi:hypothetical protein
MSDSNLYGLDNSHPIPNLDVIDINTVKKGGGSDLFIVIASPLGGDRRSLERLLRKVERYLQFLNTGDFLSESGTANPDNTRIIVMVHPESSREVFELLEKSKEWVRDNSASLSIDTNI